MDVTSKLNQNCDTKVWEPRGKSGSVPLIVPRHKTSQHVFINVSTTLGYVAKLTENTCPIELEDEPNPQQLWASCATSEPTGKEEAIYKQGVEMYTHSS